MSSLAVSRGLELELSWLGCLFSAAELAAANLLLQLSGDGEAEAPASTRTSPSPRSASSCCEDEERIVKETAVPLGLGASMELDCRARKRYRMLSELYATTRPVKPAAAKKRKGHGGGGSAESSEEEATRYST